MAADHQSGIGFPSYGSQAVLTPVATDNWNGSLPNMADPERLRLVARCSAAASFSFKAVLPANRQIQMLALVNHNALVGATFRLQFFNDTNPDPVGNPGGLIYDSGTQDFWPDGQPAGSFFTTRPYLLGAPLNVRSVLITATYPNPYTWEFGALELAGWWAWPGTSQDRQFGINSRASRETLPGNIDVVIAQWAPRIASLKRLLIPASEIETTVLDFQNAHGLWKPFVFVDDIADPPSWRRGCFMARNSALPTAAYTDIGEDEDFGVFNADLVEHL